MFSCTPKYSINFKTIFYYFCSCRAEYIPFYIGTVAPFILIYLFNWTMFTMIMAQLLRKKCHKKFSESYSDETGMTFKQQLLIAVTLSILFGLGWGFGLFVSATIFTSAAIRNIFSVIFILLTSFQGLFIFIMHCLRSAEVRKEWQRWIFRITGVKRFEPPSSMTNSSVVNRRRSTKSSSMSRSTFRREGTIESDESGPITERTIELSLGKALDDIVFPVPPIELKKVSELFPSTSSSHFGHDNGSAKCVNLDNPFEFSTCDDPGSIRSPLSPFSPHHVSHLDNPLVMSDSDKNGVINDQSPSQ